MYESLILYSLMFLVVAVGIGKQRTVRNFFIKLGFSKINPKKDLPLAIMYVGILLAASILVGLLFYGLGMTEDSAKVAEAIKTLDLTQVVVILTVASVVEEIFFRGFLQRKTNLLFASFIFSYFHIVYGSVAEMVGTFFLGLILGKEYNQTKSLYAPILSHWVYNMLTVAIIFGGV